LSCHIFPRPNEKKCDRQCWRGESRLWQFGDALCDHAFAPASGRTAPTWRLQGWSMKPLYPRIPGASRFTRPLFIRGQSACANVRCVRRSLLAPAVRFLTCPAKIAENLPDVAWMVANLKLLGDYCRDSRTGPKILRYPAFVGLPRGISATFVFEDIQSVWPGCGLAFNASCRLSSWLASNVLPKTWKLPQFPLLRRLSLLSSRSCPASRRRVSNSAALPCFLINYYTHGHTMWFIY